MEILTKPRGSSPGRAGTVISIQIAARPGEPMVPVTQVRAVAGRGLEGDRYFTQTTRSSQPEPGCAVTLIESEALDAASREAGLDLHHQDSRRNIITRDVRLNDLVGREFQVGGVTLRGVGPCEPCSHLAKLAQKPILRSLAHRGGLRADILSDGVIRVGDRIES